jgi:flavodoxin
MKSIVIYDSLYGNTEIIAQSISKALGKTGEVTVFRVGEVVLKQLIGIDLLVVGSPTQRLRPTIVIKDFLNSIPAKGLKGVNVVAFDTRFTQSKIDSLPVLPVVVRLFGGYAASPIANALKKKGGKLIAPPQGFYVEDTEGPLKVGELERVAEWVDSWINKT